MSEQIMYVIDSDLADVEVQGKLRKMYKEETDTKRLIAITVLLTPWYGAEEYLILPEVKEFEQDHNEVDWEEIADIIRELRLSVGLDIPKEEG